MLSPDPSALLKTLNAHCTRALETAAGNCVARGHYEVTVEHLMVQLLADPNADLHLTLLHFNVDKGAVEAALQRHLESLRSGNTGRPVFSPMLLNLLRDGWLLVSTEHRAPALRSAALLAALLLASHNYTTGAWVDLLDGVTPETLRKNLVNINAGSVEAEAGRALGGAGASSGDAARPSGPHSRGPETALGRFTIDFTAQARGGDLDPVIGREHEIRQCIDILARRRKNNPIIVGEAGVGKTALVEGIAQRIAAGEVPERLAGIDILGLDMGLLQAGAGVKGEFENRLKGVIEEVNASPTPIILFIDEAHTMIGAGGPQGGSDAANLLKPALARGELRTLAATTWSEYKKYFEKDPALTRRFQLVKVDEPSEENATAMMRGLSPNYERTHAVRIRDDAVVAAVEMSARYISGRQLPDKAIDLLDTCAARVAIAQDAKPAQLSDLERRVQILGRERSALEREVNEAGDHPSVDEIRTRLGAIDELLQKANDDRTSLETRWREQRDLVKQIAMLRQQVANIIDGDEAQGDGDAAQGDGDEAASDAKAAAPDAAAAPAPAAAAAGEAGAEDAAPEPTREDLPRLRSEIIEAQAKLDAMHKDDELLVPVDVTVELVASVVSDWTGIPVGKMVEDEAATLMELEQRLHDRIRGQDYALQMIGEVLRGSKLGLANPESPLGVFLLVGPSGVGKTETARVLADLLFGGERFMVTINMSEFQEKHTVSRLIGSPPGYVGYGEGGVLTEAVRQRPYSSVVLDEVEKADPEVMNLFYQVFDKGQLSDGEGRVIDFRNTVLMMTSNLGSDLMMDMISKTPGLKRSDVLAAMRPILSKHFKPALLARMTIVPYFPLGPSAMREIVDLKLAQLVDRVHGAHRIALALDEAVPEQIVARCSEVETGARNIDHILRRTLMPLISQALLEQMSSGELSKSMRLVVDEQGGYALSIEA
ncbi:MAG: type VI secretion system ATPase TssH [Myxococcales bacterium]|nr:type VI secretion system ATPase TssH [Myxococcales bacterium]